MKKITELFHKTVSSFRNPKTRFKTISTALAVLVVAVSAVSAALIVSVSPAVKNTFHLPEISNEIQETFDGSEKTSVKVKNLKDDEFLRVAVVINWQDASGNVLAQTPVAGTDYTISFNETDWTQKGNYRYYNKKLPSGETTKDLLGANAVTELNAPDGYHLAVEVIAEGIQADPEKAVKDAWGITAKNGVLVLD